MSRVRALVAVAAFVLVGSLSRSAAADPGLPWDHLLAAGGSDLQEVGVLPKYPFPLTGKL